MRHDLPEQRWVALLPAGLRERLRGRGLMQVLLGNLGWQAFDKLFRSGLGLLTTVYVARYLGPQGFGLLNFGMAFVALFSAIAVMGVQHIVGRDLVRRPADRRAILASALAIRLGGAVVTVLACVAVIRLFPAEGADSRAIVLAQAVATIPLAWEVVDYDFTARLSPRPAILVRCLACLVFSIARLAFVAMRLSVVAFAWTAAGEFALAAVLLTLAVRAEGGAPGPGDVSRREIRQLLAASWPLLLTNLSIMVYMRIDQVMLGHLADKAQAGVFSAAVRISEAWYFLPMAVVTTVAPTITAAHQTSPALYEARLHRTLQTLAWAAAAVGLVLSASSGPLIRVLYGEPYREAAPVLAVHAWAGVFVALGVAAGPWFVNEGLQKFQLLQSTVGAAVNVALNLVVIPRYGALGASAVTLASQCSSAVLVNALFPATRPIFALQLRALARPWRRPAAAAPGVPHA